jgi:hypothetical protein
MFDWFNEQWLNILIALGVVIVLFVTIPVGQFSLKYVGYLLNKRVLLVNKETFHHVVRTRDAIESNEGSVGLEQLNGLFESIAEVASHKDKLVRATGESLRKLDSKMDNMASTIAMLEGINKDLRNRDEVMSKIKTIKLLISTIDEIEKFLLVTKENYLEFIRDNIETVLIGLGVEPFELEYSKDEDMLKYYKVEDSMQTGPIKLIKKGYLVSLPEGNYVVKQSLIQYLGGE